MALTANFYGRRVAQRITLLFIIASILPITLFSTLSYRYFDHHLQDEADQKIQHAKQQFISTFNQRFKLIQDEFDIISARLSRRGNHWIKNIDKNELEKIERFFSSVVVLKEGYNNQHLFGKKLQKANITNSEKMFLKSGDTILTTKSIDGDPDIQLFNSIRPKHLTDGILVAKINSNFLLNKKSLMSPNITSCILDKNQYLYNCPFSEFRNVVPLINKAFSKDQRGFIRNEFNNKQFTLSYNELSLASNIRAPNWVLITGVVSSDMHHAIKKYLAVFFVILFGSVILVLLISINQVRRVIIPLAKLKEGTQTLGDQKFNTKVSVKSGDEFEELANSFNRMSSRLGKQFNALETMGRIDRMILSTLDINSIIETILVRMVRIVPCDTVSIVLMGDEEDKKSCKIYFRKDPLAAEISENKSTLSYAERKLLTDNPDSVLIENNARAPAFLQAIRSRHSAYLLLPIFIQGTLSAALILGYRQKPNYSSEDLVHARDIAHRVAVALSNATWEDKLYFKAHYDALTELPNRLLFQDRLQHALARADRDNTKVALLFIDMDRFKSINDSLGHDAGDGFLIETAERLKGCVRSIDTVARLGGDEFTIIIPDLRNHHESTSSIVNITNKILEATTRSYALNKQEVFSSASVGIAVYPEDANNYSELLKNSDSAMYHAKSSGKGTYKFYSDELNDEANTVVVLANQLHHAIQENQFELYYQPRKETKTHRVHGVEALLHWNHPDQGLIEPGVFNKIVEENGLTHQIHKWVIEAVCKQQKAWHQAGLKDLKVSVKLSVNQLHSRDIVTEVHHALSASRLEPKYLELEITESAIHGNIDSIIETIKTFRDMGVKISVGDFGTGHSSLNYLKWFPLDALTLDKTFIQNMGSDRTNNAIVTAVIQLAHNLNLKVVAKGVDNQQELRTLTELGCDELQGYIISPSLPVAEFEQFMQTHST